MTGNKNYVYKLFSLNGKVTVLTGGLGQLGVEYAEALANAGAHVAIFDLTDKPGKRLAKLAEAFPIMFLKVDITSEKEVKKAVKQIEKKWGPVSLLINNAGWKVHPDQPTKASVPFEEYPMDIWDEVFRVNLKGAAICSKIIGRKMIESAVHGTIINISSHFALVAPDQRNYEHFEKTKGRRFVKDAPYGASKAALLSLTRDLAVQWARYGIRVVGFCPGGVALSGADEEFVKKYNSKVPMGRMAEAHEYRGVILFLASEASSYMTGTHLVVDGGATIW